MNFLRGSFGGGGGGGTTAENEGPPKVDQDSNVRDHATFFSWKNIWTDNQEEKNESLKVPAGGGPGAPRKGRRSSRSSTGLSVIDETAGNGDPAGGRRSSSDFLSRIGNGELCDDSRDDSDTLEADDDRGSISSSETLRRESLTDGIKRVVSKTRATPSDGKNDGSTQSGYFNMPWKDKGMSFPWKKEDAGADQGSGKPSQGRGNAQKGVGGLSATPEEANKNKSRSPSRHFPWQSSDAGDSDTTSELSFTMPWKASADASKKGTGGQEPTIHFPWWSGVTSEEKKERDPSVTSAGESSEDIDSGIIGDESASLISDSKSEKTKPKEKENTNPFQNVPWFIGGGSSEKKAEKSKETHSALPNFPWSREGGEKKNGEGETWSASVNLPWLRKSGEKKKTEKGKIEGEKEGQRRESHDLEGPDLAADVAEICPSEETDDEDIIRPSVVRRVRKAIDAKTDIKIDSMKPLIKSSKHDDSGSRERIVDSDDDAKGTSTGQSPGLYLEQLVVLKTRAGRVKEKILQNLGKADKTTDDVFDEFEANFSKQQQNANRLHKEVANYLRCCRALHGASKSLFETLGDVYEPEWVGHELLYAQSQNSDMLWTDFCHKVQDQTLAPLTAYQSQFPEIRKKIDKRGRKLVDYDSQRHQLENLQRATRRDEYKIARAQDTLETARVTYEALNKELYDELPSLYDQRIPNVSNHVQSLFAAEATFMAESSKVAKELEAITDKLSKECAKGTYKSKQRAAPRPLSVVEVNKPNSPSMWYDGGADEGENSFQLNEGNDAVLEISAMENSSSAPMETEQSYKPIPDNDHAPTPPSSPLPIESLANNGADSALNPTTTPPPTHNSQADEDKRPTISGPMTNKKEEIGRPYEEIEFEDKKVNGTLSSARSNGEVIGTKIPADGGIQNGTLTGATTEGLPQGVLYRVRATYKYTREDVDEIGFEVGDIIQVVEYDDPEEQEEGWLCGIKESSGEKGLFPANFTRPL